MRSLSWSIAVLCRPFERGCAADRRRLLPVDLRAGLRRAAGSHLVEDLLEGLGREVLVVVVVDLSHRRVDASAQALDLDPGELAVRRHLILVTNAAVADVDQRTS